MKKKKPNQVIQQQAQRVRIEPSAMKTRGYWGMAKRMVVIDLEEVATLVTYANAVIEHKRRRVKKLRVTGAVTPADPNRLVKTALQVACKKSPTFLTPVSQRKGENVLTTVDMVIDVDAEIDSLRRIGEMFNEPPH